MHVRLTFLFVLMTQLCSAQSHKVFAPVRASFIEAEAGSISSFSFCSLQYKTPRSYVLLGFTVDGNVSHAHALSAGGRTFYWETFANKEIADSNFSRFFDAMVSMMTTFNEAPQPIKCVLNNTIVDGWKIIYRLSNGSKGYKLLTHGVVNGQFVMVYLVTTKEIKHNSQIHRKLQPILKLVE